MVKINFGGVEEEIVTREEFPLSKAQEVLKNETLAVIGYGAQGPAQALNLKDNGINVIVGQRKGGKSWDKAIDDGWVEGKNLFEIEAACEKATIIMYLLSDAGQKNQWENVKKYLTANKAIYFSHGFSIAYKEQTGVVPPTDVDIILVGPKGTGSKLRDLFIEGKGVNSSYAVAQDATGKAQHRVKAIGIAIGSGFLFPTTFENEVWSDLTGERGVLMGAMTGIMEAQYELFRKNGHSPSEAFNETVEELTQSLIPLIADRGMDWMYTNCSTTAQRGALDWKGKFKEATMPVFEELYERVKNGIETKNVLEANSNPNYREKLDEELKQMRESEMWQTGTQVRKLRPNKQD